MADWASLRKALNEVEASRTFDWAELDALVGGLPRSAYEHSAFWSGSRTAWSGFRATGVALGARVTFVRHEPVEASAPAAPVQAISPEQAATDLLLVTCVKEKLKRPAEARDLYVSPLFQKQRAYAEACGIPWFILSAEHGLVAPDQWLAPYERYLPDTPPTYRMTWGHWVAERLALLAGPLSAKVVEVHAASAYIDTLRTPLTDKGAVLLEPLRGLALGQRLAWYGAQRTDASNPAQSSFARRLRVEANAVSPDEFVARGARGLRAPGLYSWWVDELGAAELSRGLEEPIEPGLIYAGLAGATKWPSGTRSKQTLWSRIKGNHIDGRHQGSTFRLTLGSVLAATRDWPMINEAELTAWMYEHLRVIALPYDDAETLGRLENEVLPELDPPLNLMGMDASIVRSKLSALRRTYGQ